MIETTKRVVCDRCGATGPEALESEDPVVLAEREGWQVNGDDDRCPTCAALCTTPACPISSIPRTSAPAGVCVRPGTRFRPSR